MNRILVLGNADSGSGVSETGIYTAVGLSKLCSHVAFLVQGASEKLSQYYSVLEKNNIDTDFIMETERQLSEKEAYDLDLSGICTVFFSGRTVLSFDEKFICALCRRCREQEIDVVFDPDIDNGNRVCIEKINKIAGLSDIFVPSREDAELLCGLTDPESIADYYIGLGAKKVVVTLDKNGAFYKSDKEKGLAPTFRAEEVVDTSGAGDAFAAGLLSGISEDIPLGEAVVRANACGCIAIQSENVMDSFPDMQQLMEYMLSHRFVVDGCKEF